MYHDRRALADRLAARLASYLYRSPFEIDDYVEKYKGEARYSGWIVCRYQTRRGKLRYVVEVDPQGFQMIGEASYLRWRI